MDFESKYKKYKAKYKQLKGGLYCSECGKKFTDIVYTCKHDLAEAYFHKECYDIHQQKVHIKIN
jgi:hypothetical protein